MKRIVTIGGGGGHSQVLFALKDIPGIAITAVCPSTDSGGSTGTFQQEYGGNGYIGDLTKCIVALCDDDLLGRTLSYRYRGGPLNGHTVKNVLFHAAETEGGLDAALELMRRICGLGAHRVLPVTREKTELCAELSIGNTVTGETNIDTIAKNPLWHPDVHSISRIYLKPAVPAAPEVLAAIAEADHVIVSPGDLYSSIIPVLLPEGMEDALRATKAQVTLILNIMTKQGETDNYTTADFIASIEARMGRQADRILCNDAPITEEALLRYALEHKVKLDPAGIDDPRITLLPLALVHENGQVVSDPAVIRAAVERIL